MKWLLVMFFLGFTVFEVEKKMNHENRGVYHSKSFSSFAVLELFTSEGCSSCPPADRLLPQLAATNANIIPLSFHVDYWDRLGWKDPFSNATFTDHQREYAKQFNLESIYTPQLVINGEYEMIGNDKRAAENNIKKILSKESETRLVIDGIKKEHNKLLVDLHANNAMNGMDILAVLVQKHAEVNVKAGENKGAKLSHTNVVNTFVKFHGSEKMKFEISIPENIANENWELIIFARQQNNLRIIAAATYKP